MQTISAPDVAQEQIEQIIREVEERGYYIARSVISTEETDRVRGILQGILQAEHTAEIDRTCHQRVFQIAVKNRVFLELMAHPLVVGVWKKYLGEDVICSTWSSNTMYPGMSCYDWHADYPYWAITPPWPAGNFTGQTIWLLDDFTSENGATGVVPFSHRKLHPPSEAERRVARDDAELVIAPRGSVAFLHGALWHSARPNQSASPRTALLGMYLRPFCVPMENMRAQLAQIPDASDIEKQLLGANQRWPG